MPPEEEEIIFRGIPISKGIGIGFPIFFAGAEDQVLEGRPAPHVPTEVADLAGRRVAHESIQEIIASWFSVRTGTGSPSR